MSKEDVFVHLVKTGKYIADGFGRIHLAVDESKKGAGKLIVPRRVGRPNNAGYLYFRFTWRGESWNISVHRAIYSVFRGKIPEGKHINHIDGDKSNNCIGNLEVVTRQENQQHAFKMGLCSNDRFFGEGNHMAKLREVDVIRIRQDYADGKYTQKQLAIQYAVTQPAICSIIKRRKWAHLP